MRSKWETERKTKIKTWDKKWEERGMNKIILLFFTIYDGTITQF